MLIAVPPTHEQREIATHIDRISQRIGEVLTPLNHQLEMVREYRTRLISDVVTGTLDVRQAAATLPDELDSDVLDTDEEDDLDGENEPTDEGPEE